MSLQSQFDYLLTRIDRLNQKSGGINNSTTTNNNSSHSSIATANAGDNNSFFSSNNIIFSQLKSSSNINNPNGNNSSTINNKNNNNKNSNNNIILADYELDETILIIISDIVQLYHSQQQQLQQASQQQQQQQQQQQLTPQQLLQQQQTCKDYYIKLILKLCQYVQNDNIALKFFQMTILLSQNNQLSLQDYSNELSPLLQLFQKYIQLNPNLNNSNNNNNNNNKHHHHNNNINNTPNNFQTHQYTTVRIEALKALSLLLYNNGPSVPSKFHQPLFDSLLLLANLQPTANNPSPLSINQETKRLATISIGNLCVPCGSKLSKYYPILFEKLYSNLEKLVVQLSSDQHIIKFTCSTLRSLQLILTQCKGVYDNKASLLLGILKRLMFFGTTINPNAVLPSQLHSVEPYKLSLKKKKNRDIGDLSDGISSSDSDVDERYSFAKVRLSTLSLLSTLCKSSPKLFFGHWTTFLPSQKSMPSLITAALFDQDYRVRLAAIQVLTTIFDGCKDLLVAIPKVPSTPTSFTSFSQILTAMIQESHRGLQLIIEQEKNSNLLVPAIKCLTVLLSNSPYERLPSGLLSQLMKLIAPFLNNSALDVQLATLSGIMAILSAEPPTPDELTDFFAQNDIVERVIQFASNPSNSDHMRIEATQCILALTKHNFQMFCKYHESIYTTLFSLLTTTTLDSTLRIQSSKTIEEISKSIHESQKSNVTFEPIVEKRLWDLFFNSLTGLIEDPLPQIRSSICNCLSHLTSNVFANLPMHLQLHSVTVILGLMSDDSYLVRASSCRTIGMFVKLETLADDTTFLSKSASCLYKSMCDNNINIRIKACWSLANLCDHLVSIRKDEVFNDIPTLILSKVVEVLLLASYDNPKVRSNAVRALGNFARFAPKELLYNSTPVDIQDIFDTIQQNQQLQSLNPDPSKTQQQSNTTTSEQNSLTYNHKNMMDNYVKNHHKSLIDRIIDSLVINAAEPSTSFNFVKVKWNACYALGNLFYNSDIQFDPTPKWLHQIYETLVYLVPNCKNYKIKINASASLATPNHNRTQYAEDYHTILETIINSLSNVNTLIDHSEYQYKDILERQLGVSLIHLLGEMTFDEIETYQTLLLTHSEIIYETFEKLNPNDQALGKKQDRPTILEYNQGMATIKQFIDHYNNNNTQFESDCQLRLTNLKKLFEDFKIQ